MENHSSNSCSIPTIPDQHIIIADNNADVSIGNNEINSSTNNQSNKLLDEPHHKKLTAKYWYVQPGKFVLDAFRNNKNQLYCDPETKLFPANFTIEGNGNKANAHGCFKCSVCKKKWRDTEFYVKILGGNPEDIPKKTPPKKKIPVNINPDNNITSFVTTFNNPSLNNCQSLLPSNVDNFGLDQNFFLTNQYSNLVSENVVYENFCKKMDEHPPNQDKHPPNQDEHLPNQDEHPPNQDEHLPNQDEHLPNQDENSPNMDEHPPNQDEHQLYKDCFIEKPISRKRYAADPDSIDTTSNISNNQMDRLMNKLLVIVDQKIAAISKVNNNQSSIPNNIQITKTVEDSDSILNLKKENYLLKKKISEMTCKIDSLIQLPSKNITSITKTISNPSSNSEIFTAQSSPNQTLLCSPKKDTFVDIAKQRLKSGSNEEITKFSEAMRLLAGVKPLGTGTKSEKKHKVARLYVQGITRQPIHRVKKLLAILKFRLTKILHMDFIGKSTLEFTVMEEYARSFVTHIKAFEFMTIMPKIDPSKPMDFMATEETKEIIKQAFQRRINNAIQNTNKQDLREYLIDLADEHGLVVDPIVNEDSIPEEFYEDSDGDSVEMDEI
ncbi:hypothetical protein BB559_005958 [Furculomyces boomerangus]|uniref:Uncharacterized protein n=1 Tax=Furculomyces boomerangus TaxID=61424 RepID=A0A2T9Y5L1_9FUNG|nr:hypothetical protein BB559_005958 [Furculomyces boomerangus]